ncbi:hypothetical protein DQ392_11960 [Streptomyces reniochalinae]|uniref:Uncharacterized protein n=1 Tax=Streptomyces reniochalinae TaxID=2250578 RepID=A0A367EN13_9ACTN|nr:hypothetical protein DQ392_11960 [Streptomyces reniochalinae]
MGRDLLLREVLVQVLLGAGAGAGVRARDFLARAGADSARSSRPASPAGAAAAPAMRSTRPARTVRPPSLLAGPPRLVPPRA